MAGALHGAFLRKASLAVDWTLCGLAPDVARTPQELRSAPADWLTATCPGTVAEALAAAGRPPEGPSPGLDAHDWWYRGRIVVPSDTPSGGWTLDCAGLATLTELWLDGVAIGTADNMHRPHRFAIETLGPGEHELLIRFRSVDRWLSARRPRPRWRTPMVAHQQLRHLRTTLLGRTPGWSPPYPAIGPWRAITLTPNAIPALHDLRVSARLEGADGHVSVTASLAGVAPHASLEARLRIRGHGIDLTQPMARDGDQLSGALTIPAVSRWWPHTHGTPALYALSIDVESSALPDGHVDLPLAPVGFRSLRLDTSGDGFRLIVNELPIFCRGACWTPLDVKTLSASPEDYATALGQAADAGMNLLRVGGTMVYEADDFYREASRRGLLIWQDFMFANMDYPGEEPGFRDEVCAEAMAFLARVGAEACVGVLCGNSEVEQQAAMWGAPRALWSPPLFHDTLSALCHDQAPGVPYWPSSAHGGAFPHQSSAGTSSYYGVGAYLRPLEDARRSDVRFATECLGFANVPEPSALAELEGGEAVRVHSPAWKARSPRDVGAGWDFDDVRDHYLTRLYGVDPAALRYADHERYLALSRVVSGEAMARAFAEWRRPASGTGGALVWFLRDLWAGAGWGLVAADGTPKAAWYLLRRALQPRAVFFLDEGVNGLDLLLYNDGPARLEGLLTLRVYARGEQLLERVEVPVTVAAHGAKRLAVAACFESFIDLSYAYRFGPAAATLIVATLVGADGTPIAEAMHLPAGPRLEPDALELSATGHRRPDGMLELALTTRRHARAVRVDVPGALPEDNYFDLAPGATRVVLLRPGQERPRLGGTVGALNLSGQVGITWTERP